MYLSRSGFDPRSYTVEDVDWSLTDEVVRRIRGELNELRFLSKQNDAYREKLSQPKPIEDSELLKILET